MHENIKFAFDLEGTLVDNEKIHRQAFLTVANELGIDFSEEDHLRFAGVGDRALSNELARIADSRYVSSDQIRTLKVSIYQDLMRSHQIKPREGVSDYLEQAKMFGSKLLIASATTFDNVDHILKKSGLSPFFSYVLTAEDVSSTKPDPEVYIKAARLLETSPKNMIVHEDTPVGVTAGKRAGSPVVAFPVFPVQFDPKPDLVFLSWSDVNPKRISELLVKSNHFNHSQIR